jgi:hypothetical protein
MSFVPRGVIERRLCEKERLRVSLGDTEDEKGNPLKIYAQWEILNAQVALCFVEEQKAGSHIVSCILGEYIGELVNFLKEPCPERHLDPPEECPSLHELLLKDDGLVWAHGSTRVEWVRDGGNVVLRISDSCGQGWELFLMYENAQTLYSFLCSFLTKYKI